MPTENRPVWIEKLREPHRYGPDVTQVELIETHISWVLLAGDFAYKIKKPVDLGFVDFSTLEKREFFCHEELRLNGRLTPGLYLDVQTIRGTEDDPHWSDAGPVLEYAVRMRRFPQELLLPHVLERGELRPDHIDRLADDVAEFHTQCETASEESPAGTPDRVAKPVRDNFGRIPFPDADQSIRDRVEQLRLWTEQECRRREQVFIARKRTGCIRECHGDMHLGNMLLRDDRIALFDCIEFNPALRWIDVASEIAFLVMDLADRGRPDLGNRFLNAWLSVTGDYGALSVFRYYAVYRALVRAKVACIRWDQTGAGTERTAIEQEFQQYLTMAEGYTRPGQAALLITHGLSGSGKTTGTQPLVERVGAIRLRSDVERKRLFGLRPTDSSRSEISGGIYSAEATTRTYTRLAELARVVLAAGFPAVIDATFLRIEERRRFHALAEELQVPFLILDFTAPEPVLRERIAARSASSHDASEANADVLDLQLQTAEPLTSEETQFCITATPTTLADEVAQRLQPK